MNDQDLNDLLKEFDNPHHCYPPHLVHAIRLLVNQRDDARQMYCNAMTDHCEEHEARQIAKEQGWDCFKENA